MHRKEVAGLTFSDKWEEAKPHVIDLDHGKLQKGQVDDIEIALDTNIKVTKGNYQTVQEVLEDIASRKDTPKDVRPRPKERAVKPGPQRPKSGKRRGRSKSKKMDEYEFGGVIGSSEDGTVLLKVPGHENITLESLSESDHVSSVKVSGCRDVALEPSNLIDDCDFVDLATVEEISSIFVQNPAEDANETVIIDTCRALHSLHYETSTQDGLKNF